MDHSTVALIGPLDWAGSVGKETSNTSFGIGALKKDDRIVTTLYPSKYPEKIWSLLFPLSLADEVFLYITTIDRYLGETIIALDLAGKKNGSIHIATSLDRSMLERIIKGTVVENYAVFDPDPPVFRERLFTMPPKGSDSETMVIVDQAFNVKGVGTVVLGFVTRGEVKKHQELHALPSGKRTQVRSIQVHDRDQVSTPSGSRVGLALKNIEPDDLPRGTALVSQPSPYKVSESINARIRVSDHWKDDIVEGGRYHLWASLQFVPAIIRKVDGPSGGGSDMLTVEIETESRVWFREGLRVGLSFLDSRSFRLFASGETI